MSVELDDELYSLCEIFGIIFSIVDDIGMLIIYLFIFR